MEVAAYLCGFLVVVAGTALGIASLRGHWYIGLWAGVATIIAATMGLGFGIHEYWKKLDAAVSRASGTLAPGDGTSNELRALAQQWGADRTFLFLGNKTVVVAKTLPYTVIQQDDTDMLSIARPENGALTVTAELFDAFGKPIGTIKQNRFDLKLPAGYTHLSGDHHLTILDELSELVVKIELVNNHAIRIRGNYHLRGGEPIKFGEQVEYLGTKLGITIELPSPALCVEGDAMGFGGCISQLRKQNGPG